MSDVKNLNLRNECVNDMDTKEIISTHYENLEIVQDFILDICNHPDDTKDKAYVIFLKHSDKELQGISFASQYDQLPMLQSFIEKFYESSHPLMRGEFLGFLDKFISKELSLINPE